jgi:hypothetical protein
MRSLRLPAEIVSVFRMEDAPEVLRDIDLTGDAKAVYVVPDGLASVFVILGASFSEQIKGGTVYVV